MLVFFRDIFHGPRDTLFCRCRLELFHVGFRDIAGDPDKVLIRLGGVAGRGKVHPVLELHHLVVEARLIDGGRFECFIALRNSLPAVFDLLFQLRSTVLRKHELRCRDLRRKCSEDRHRIHLVDGGQADQPDILIVHGILEFFASHSVKVEIKAFVLQSLHIFRREISPCRDSVKLRIGRADRLVERLFFLHGIQHAPVHLFEFAVTQDSGFFLLRLRINVFIQCVRRL